MKDQAVTTPIQLTWITFQNNQCQHIVNDAGSYSSALLSCFKACLCRCNPGKANASIVRFKNQDLRVIVTKEPDQILWRNLQYPNKLR